MDKIIVGVGSDQERSLSVKRVSESEFKDNRQIIIYELENDSFVIDVQNPKNSERGRQNMWLTKESFIGVISSVIQFMQESGFDLDKELSLLAEGKSIPFFYQDNTIDDE